MNLVFFNKRLFSKYVDEIRAKIPHCAMYVTKVGASIWYRFIHRTVSWCFVVVIVEVLSAGSNFVLFCMNTP